MARQVIRPAVVQSQEITRLAAGASVSLVGKVTGGGLYAVSQVVLARLLGPEAFGLYAIGWSILRLVWAIAPLGLDKGVVRFASHYWRTDPSGSKKVLFQSLVFGLSLGLLIGISLFVAAPWVAEGVFQKPDLTPVLRWFALAFPLATGLRVAAAATRVSQRMRFSVYAEDLGQPATNLILVLLFYLLGWGLLGAVAASVSSFGLAFLLALYYMKHLFPEVFSTRRTAGPSARELIAFSLPTAFAGIFAIVTIWADRLLVGHFRPAAEVGVYQAFSQVSVLFAITLSALNAIFSPMIADLYHKKEMGRLGELFRVSTKWGLYLSLPVFLVICFTSQELMMVVFGPQYADGALPLVVLATGQLVNVATGAVGFLLIMTGHQNRWLAISSVAVLISVALNWLLIPRLGLTGAALATATAISGLYLAGLFQVRCSLQLWPYDSRYLKGLLATALAVAALFLLRLAPIDSAALTLLLTVTVSGSVFGGTLLLLGLDAEDQEFIRLIQTRLTG
jgi:O-antigen/teichoic acid export membrane protein